MAWMCIDFQMNTNTAITTHDLSLHPVHLAQLEVITNSIVRALGPSSTISLGAMLDGKVNGGRDLCIVTFVDADKEIVTRDSRALC